MSTCLQHAPVRPSLLRREVAVFRARDFRVIEGVNEGDPLADAAELAYGDVYTLDGCAVPVRLGLVTAEAGHAGGAFLVSRDSDAGRPGARVYLDSVLTFIGPMGSARDVLVFVEVDADSTIAEVYFSALTPLMPQSGQTLIDIDRSRARVRRAVARAFAQARRIGAAGTGRAPSRSGAVHPGQAISRSVFADLRPSA